MRKKFMLVAALAGILSMSSCVDDKESASVEAVRNAKAKQIEALAAKYNAEAEATLIAANAEKALTEAKTAYERAKAEAEQANAEQKKLELEKAKESYALELEAIKANAQADIAEAKKRAQEAEQALLDAADERIAELYGVYSREANELTGLNSQLLDEKITLKGLQADLIGAETYVKKQTVSFNNTIAKETAKLEALKALPANNRAELEAQLEKYNADLKPLEANRAVKNDALNKARNTYNDGRDNLSLYNSSDIKLVQAVEALYNLGFFGVNQTSYDLTADKTITTYALKQGEVTTKKNDLTATAFAAKEYLGKPKAGSIAATGVYIQLEVLQDAYKTAQNTYNNDRTEPNRYAMEQAKAAVENYQLNTVEQAKKDLEEANAKLGEFTALVDMFSGDDLTAYETALATLKKQAEAFEKAEDELKEVNDKIAVINDLKGSVNGILGGTADLPQLIADAEDAIAQAQKGIANLRDVADVEKAIAFSEETITRLEAQIAAKKIIVEKAKAALDAALKA